MKNEFFTTNFQDMTVVYNTFNDITSFTVVPSGMEEKIVKEKLSRTFNPKFSHIASEPMVQVALKGDSPKRDFSSGMTLHDAATSLNLRFISREVNQNDSSIEVITLFNDGAGLEVKHFLKQIKGYPVLECHMEICNLSYEVKVLELASSFSLGNISPFCKENMTDKIKIHRLQNQWSGEARKETVLASTYNLEDAWSSLGVRSLRFGQSGSMPARGYLPFVAIEDTQSGVTWAVSMQAPSSWIMEVLNKNGGLAIYGGQGDFLSSHWRKNLSHDEVFVTDKAFLTCVQGGLEDACANLVDYQSNNISYPKSEESLPVIYNEYLYTWGNPSLKKLIPQMASAKELGAEYFVVDAGWFSENGSWNELGDWELNRQNFEGGLEELQKEIVGHGLTLGGIWYEFENLSQSSAIYKRKDLLLHMDNAPINHEGRLFLDFRKAGTEQYLCEKVIEPLKQSGLRYIKIDYNENIGLGVDGAESYGEGLRQHINKVTDFYELLRKEIPDLVMEVCSSGGMRHEPKFISLGSMVSFSDAHEGAEGAVIAADLHRFIPPRMSQIWACLKEDYSRSDIYFTMVKAMLGRICLSGDLVKLDSQTKSIVKDGIDFYNAHVKNIIKDGRTILIDSDEIHSLRHLKGSIRLVRKSKDGKQMLCYAFSFNDPHRKLDFDTKGYKISACYGNGAISNSSIISDDSRWCGTVMLLDKNN